ncbi:hypothetical protein [Tsukamurella pulmonis]|uniref:hypothetical protein n=2 Tax=Tsukamurella pulmonis TaxID=47312 RepID=UPI000A7A8D32|nr:hypothetical protein [Tsukamurella pulmonis]
MGETMPSTTRLRRTAATGGALLAALAVAAGPVQAAPGDPTLAGTDTHGFTTQPAARCDGADRATALFTGGNGDPYRFVVCRTANGAPYLRAWANGRPSLADTQGPRIGLRGTAVNGSDTLFAAGGTTVDVGVSPIAIRWPDNGAGAWTVSYPIRAAWHRG